MRSSKANVYCVNRRILRKRRTTWQQRKSLPASQGTDGPPHKPEGRKRAVFAHRDSFPLTRKLLVEADLLVLQVLGVRHLELLQQRHELLLEVALAGGRGRGGGHQRLLGRAALAAAAEPRVAAVRGRRRRRGRLHVQHRLRVGAALLHAGEVLVVVGVDEVAVAAVALARALRAVNPCVS